MGVTKEDVFRPSDDVVAREIEGELILVPLAAGIGDAEDELYSLNEAGRAVWVALDGRRSLGEVAAALSDEFAASAGEIERDVLGLVDELADRKLVEKV